MADILICDKERLTKRFSCECMTPCHNLTVTIEFREGGEPTHCEFDFYLSGKAPLKWRIKEAFKLLTGRDGQANDFVFRLEDAKDMLQMMAAIINNPHTLSTDWIPY